jgi:uncharacterized GH25 family protein
MKKIILALVVIALCTSHTMFLKLDSYFLEPNSPVSLQLFNGTFEKSENVITRDRMLDASIVGNGKRSKVANSQWTEKDSITFLNFTTGAQGTYVAGISTKPRSLTMEAKAFNTYLEHEGIYDMLEWRKKNNALDSSATEKYSKHVKTIFQVGDNLTDDWQTNLGYPIEFIPLTNPYGLHTGDSIEVKLLRNGKPLANQLVYADYKGHKDSHTHDSKASNEHSHGDSAPHSHEDQDNGHSKEHSHGDAAPHSHDNEDNGHSNEHSHGNVAPHSHDNKDTGHSKEHSHGNGEPHRHDNENTGHSKEHSHGDAEPHSHEHKDSKHTKEHSHHEGNKADTDEPNANNEEEHTHATGQKLRTNADGVVKAHLSADGIWYLQTIHLVNTQEEGLTHESNWSTLTFEVTHKHDASTHTHGHEHEHEDDNTLYFFIIGSVLLIGVLFFWFNKKKAANEN